MEVVIEKLDHLGKGITRVDNKVCFIDGVLPNEFVDIDIIDDKKNYMIGKCNKIIKKSPDRIESKCPFLNECGGCSLGHLDYDKSIDYKSNKLKNIIYKSINETINPIVIKSNNIYNYRNKITLKINNYEWGYYNTNSHVFVPINKCLLAKEPINNIIANKNIISIKDGAIVIRCNNKNEILISIKTNDKYEIDFTKLEELNIIGIVVNDKCIFGNSFFYHKIGSINYKISYNSFFQINDYILNEVFNILDKEELGECILDLYCGVGTLGLSQHNNIKSIYGIEVIDNAIIDAKENAKNNNINNALFYTGKVEDCINNIKDKVDTIIVDPPRKGLSNIDEILNINTNKLVYMSCDPVTLGRDLKELTKHYNIKKTYMLDMFPQTYHV